MSQLRPACPRRRTFFWLVVVLAALCTRQDLAGVTKLRARPGCLRARCYGCLLDFIHSPALCPDNLARRWCRLLLKVHPGVVRCRGRLFAQGGQLVSRLRHNACAFEPVPPPARRRGRGRPRRLGRKVRLRELFAAALQTMPGPVYGKQGVTLQWTARDLLWRPAGCLVRIVAVVHPTRGRIPLLSTDLALAPA